MLKTHHAAVRRITFLAAVAGSALAAGLVSPAAQAATCASRTTVTPFASLGDTNTYFLAPGGSFEGGAPGWSLSNAATGAGNEPFFFHGSADTTSLRVSGSATSPAFCITRNDPQLRFVARSMPTASGGNYSQLSVSVVVRNAAGSQATFYLGQLQPEGSAWFVSPALQYGSLLDGWLFGSDGTGTATMHVQFTVAGQGGTWFVDDLYVDPFSGK
jgi:hypothetical protein